MLKHSIISMAVLSLLLLACGKTEEVKTSIAIPIMKVTTERPLITDMQEAIKIYGEIKIRNEAHVASQFEGRLSDFNKLPGDRVKKGERIGTVIPAEREALLQVTDSIDDSLKHLLNNQMQPIPLYSPIDGVVLSVKNHTGDLILKGEAIMHLGNLNILDVNADLPIKYLDEVKRMDFMNLSFLSYPHSDLVLPIKAISGNVNPSKQTITIRLELKNGQNKYHPGMQVILSFPTAIHKNAITLSRNSVIEEEGIYSIFILRENKVEKREVQVGILHNDRVEIISGINKNEIVVSDKAYSLTDGMEVSEK